MHPNSVIFWIMTIIAAENYDAKTPELSPVLQNDFVSLGQAAAIKEVESGIISSNVEYGSSPGAPLEDHSNDSFPASSCNVLMF